MCSAGILTSVKSHGFRTDVTLSSASPSPRTLKRQTKQQHSCLQRKSTLQPHSFTTNLVGHLLPPITWVLLGNTKHLQTSPHSKQTEESPYPGAQRILDSSSKVVFGCRPAGPRAVALHSICLFLPDKGPFLQLCLRDEVVFFFLCLMK